MESYNCKVKYFNDGGFQTRIYSNAVYVGKKSEPTPREYIENPFDGLNVEVVRDFNELEKREERARAVSRNRTIGMVYDYARANEWEFFVTLTFNPDKVNRFDYSECQKRLTSWLNYFRKRCPDFKYLVVPELHKGEDSAVDEKGRRAWHFHGLFSGTSDIMEFSGHFDKKRKPIYNVGNYKLGWSTATEVENQVAVCKYITKYITKDLCDVTKGRKRYWFSYNLRKPHEQTYLLSPDDKALLFDELIEDCTSFRRVIADVGGGVQSIAYIESKEGVLYMPDWYDEDDYSNLQQETRIDIL